MHMKEGAEMHMQTFICTTVYQWGDRKEEHANGSNGVFETRVPAAMPCCPTQESELKMWLLSLPYSPFLKGNSLLLHVGTIPPY